MSAGGYLVHPGADDDLYAIWEFMFEVNPQAAESILVEIRAAFNRIAKFPRLGHVRPDIAGRDYRFTVVGAYLILYNSRQNPPVILAVAHGKQDPRVIASTLRSRS